MSQRSGSLQSVSLSRLSRRLVASILGDGAIDVPHKIGWHPVQPFAVIPRRHQETDTDPDRESDPACHPGTSQAGVAAAVEIQDRSDSVKDLPQRLEVGDEPEETPRASSGTVPPDEASAR